MANKQIISTKNAPSAIGAYSQAVRTGNTVYISGQIPLDPSTMEVVEGGFEAEARRVFENLKGVAEASGGSLNDVVRATIYMLDLANFATVNEIMAEYFDEPYPARAAVGVAQLPKDVTIEMDAILELRTSQ
ncbi:MAG: RidA family protein [Proteobacteria bacterium]|nr:RidA family protein [Pseudomonadota bacterium]